MSGDYGIPMPARERYYPGTDWIIRDYHEVPEHLRGLRVTLFTELMQDESETDIPGFLFTYAHLQGESPADGIIKIDDVAWLE